MAEYHRGERTIEELREACAGDHPPPLQDEKGRPMLMGVAIKSTGWINEKETSE